MKIVNKWLNRWIRPSTTPSVVKIQKYGYTDRTIERCWCGGGLITFYSRSERVCISAKCGRRYHLDNGVEIKHQR